MENNEISIHEIRVYLALKESGAWMTNIELAAVARVARRTASHHTKRLVDLGVLDKAEVFPSHKFRLSEKASKRNNSYFQRLEKARAIFGV